MWVYYYLWEQDRVCWLDDSRVEMIMIKNIHEINTHHDINKIQCFHWCVPLRTAWREDQCQVLVYTWEQLIC